MKQKKANNGFQATSAPPRLNPDVSRQIPTKGKTRITIYIDDAVLNEFRSRAERIGSGYQTMMNEALRAYLEKNEQPVTAAVLRQIIREEFPRKSRLTRRSTGRAKMARR